MGLPARLLLPFRVTLAACLCLHAWMPVALAQTAPDPARPAEVQPVEPEKRTLYLSAFFSEKGEQVRSGVMWRIFKARTGAGGDMPVVVESDASAPVFALEPGLYVVHAAYGLAAVARRISIGETTTVEKVVLDAGGLKVSATIKDQPIAVAMLTSRIHAILPTGERRLIAENVPSDNIIRLPAGRYFVECTYGDSNATVSAEIDIKAGQLTDATFHHNAATLTLKLVNQSGGEALADTSWSILTPGGDVIRESIGAFPSVILAEGNYTVVARHDGRVYTREFDVKAGLDQDVEVIAR